MATNLRALVGKLNATSRNVLEAAAGLCLSRTHYDIEIEHVLLKLAGHAGMRFWFHRAALRGGYLASDRRARA
jgi:hypothetical protein